MLAGYRNSDIFFSLPRPSQLIRVDAELLQHRGQQTPSDLFFEILERCRFIPECDPAVASFANGRVPGAGNVLATRKLLNLAFEFRTLSPVFSLAHLCAISTVPRKQGNIVALFLYTVPRSFPGGVFSP
jgi:hypothetical protein